MYIFELITKLRSDYKKKTGIFADKNASKQDFKKEYPKCNHIFVPVDSTGKVLACSKCGVIIHKK